MNASHLLFLCLCWIFVECQASELSRSSLISQHHRTISSKRDLGVRSRTVDILANAPIATSLPIPNSLLKPNLTKTLITTLRSVTSHVNSLLHVGFVLCTLGGVAGAVYLLLIKGGWCVVDAGCNTSSFFSRNMTLALLDMAMLIHFCAWVFDMACVKLRLYLPNNSLSPWNTPINAYIRLLYLLTTLLILSGYGTKHGFSSDAHWQDVEEATLNCLVYFVSLLGTLIKHPEVIFMPYAYLHMTEHQQPPQQQQQQQQQGV